MSINVEGRTLGTFGKLSHIFVELRWNTKPPFPGPDFFLLQSLLY
jgi:hypothetical protein